MSISKYVWNLGLFHCAFQEYEERWFLIEIYFIFFSDIEIGKLSFLRALCYSLENIVKIMYLSSHGQAVHLCKSIFIFYQIFQCWRIEKLVWLVFTIVSKSLPIINMTDWYSILLFYGLRSEVFFNNQNKLYDDIFSYWKISNELDFFLLDPLALVLLKLEIGTLKFSFSFSNSIQTKEIDMVFNQHTVLFWLQTSDSNSNHVLCENKTETKICHFLYQN